MRHSDVYKPLTDDDKDALGELQRVAEANPKLAALTILSLQGVIHDMEDYAVGSAHADNIVNSMRSAYLG